MTTFNPTNTFVAYTKIQSAQVNTNFTDINTWSLTNQNSFTLGAAQTANGTTTSATFAAFSNSLGISFTAPATGTYEIGVVGGVVMGNSTPSDAYITIANTSGTEVSNTTVGVVPVLDGLRTLASPVRVSKLTSGVAYVYTLSGKTASGTLTAYFATGRSEGTFMYARLIGP